MEYITIITSVVTVVLLIANQVKKTSTIDDLNKVTEQINRKIDESQVNMSKQLAKIEAKIDSYDERIRALELELARLKATYQI